MSLLQKPKRTLSNLSIEDFSKAKEIYRISFQEYRTKFHYEPDWDASSNNKKMITTYEKKKKAQASKILFSPHSYSVQSNRNINVNLKFNDQANNQETPNDNQNKRQRPTTANSLNRRTQKIRDQPTTSKNLSQLFQNQHLSSTLQISEVNPGKKEVKQNKFGNTNYRPSSTIIKRTSVWSNNFVVKTGIVDFHQQSSRQIHYTKKEDNQQMINTILSKKENFYNPYNIGPKLIGGKQIKAIKNLRNSSIRQLKQLCQEERNMNFSEKINEKQNILRKSQNTQKVRQSLERNSFFKLINESPSKDTFGRSKNDRSKLEKKRKNGNFSKKKEFTRNPLYMTQDPHANRINYDPK